MLAKAITWALGHVNTIEQLAEVKRIPVEAVDKERFGCVERRRSLVAAMASACRGSVVFFSHSADNPLLVKRRAEGGRVVFTRDGSLVLAHGPSEFSLITLDRVPLTHAGKIKFQVENVMAAVAATWALGVPAEFIRAGLETFAPSLDSSPGRFNVFFDEWRYVSRRLWPQPIGPQERARCDCWVSWGSSHCGLLRSR